MAYSNDEIQAAVERLVRSNVMLGSSRQKNVDPRADVAVLQFDAMQEAAASAFVRNPNAVHYLHGLALDRLHAMVATTISDIETLEAKVEATGRRVRPIDSIDSLVDAKNALLGLEASLLNRTTAASDLSATPSYQQWNSSSLRYLKKVGEAVKEDGVLVDTPNQARKEIPSLVASILESYAAIDELRQAIVDGMGQYESLQIPANVARNVVSKARQMLDDDATELDPMGEQERLEVAKEKTLNILSARALVDAYTKKTDPTALAGTLTPYADTDHEAVPATAYGDVPGPYALVSYPVPFGSPADSRDNNKLLIATETGSSELILPTSYIAFLIGNGKPQPPTEYDPSQPVPPIDPNDPTKLYTFYGTGEELGTNSSYVTWKNSQSIPAKTQLPGTGSPKGAKYCNNFTNDPDKIDQWFFPEPNDVLYVEQLIEGGATTRYEIHMIDKLAWPQVDGRTIFEYPDPGLLPPYPDCQDWSGYTVQLTLQQVIDRINAVLITQSSYLRAYVSATGSVEIRVADPIAAVVTNVVGVRIPNVIVASVETNTAARNPLGFVMGLQMMSKRLPATSVTEYINSNTTKATAAVHIIPADPLLASMRAWTNLSNKSGVVLAKYSGYGNLVSSGATITITSLITLTTYAIAVGDVIALPRQYVKDGATFVPMADEGARYQVTAVSANSITATHLSGPTAISYYIREFDVGSPIVISNLAKYDILQIETPPNDGAYEITSIDSYSPFRVYFDFMLSEYKQEGENLPLELVVTLGPASIALSSAALTTSSSISVSGTARPLFFSTVPTATGTSTYVQLSKDPGRLLERFDTITLKEVGGTWQTRTVKNIEGTILTLDAAVDSTGTWNVNGALPTAEIATKTLTQSQLKVEALTDWTSQEPKDVTTYARNLNAKLNPLLVNNVVAAGRVAEALSSIATLKTKLQALSDLSVVSLQEPGEDALPESYYVKPVEAVDDLLATLKAKGCDRGADLLLSCKFNDFFGADLDELSYAGTLMKTARTVAQNELTPSKFGSAQLQRKVISSEQGTDPDYDLSDSEGLLPNPDPSSGSDITSHPDPY